VTDPGGIHRKTQNVMDLGRIHRKILLLLLLLLFLLFLFCVLVWLVWLVWDGLGAEHIPKSLKAELKAKHQIT